MPLSFPAQHRDQLDRVDLLFQGVQTNAALAATISTVARLFNFDPALGAVVLRDWRSALTNYPVPLSVLSTEEAVAAMGDLLSRVSTPPDWALLGAEMARAVHADTRSYYYYYYYYCPYIQYYY